MAALWSCLHAGLHAVPALALGATNALDRTLRAVVGFVEEVTDPYLNVFRRVIPPLGGGGFALDLSPMLAMILLYMVGELVVGAIRG